MQSRAIGLILTLLLAIEGNLSGQNEGIVIDDKTRLFQLHTDVDTIEFIKLDTSIRFKKPVFIMLQGSLPIPLMVNSPSGAYYTSFPYSNKEIRKSHHVINISMPNIPVMVEPHEISVDGRLIDPSPSYNRNNFLENYVRRTSAVIEYLSEQRWVDTSQIVLFGHSQGSYVAIKSALKNTEVDIIALSSFNPSGRISGLIDVAVALEHLGYISSHEAQNRINEFYDRWAHLVKNAHDDTAKRGDTYKATVSFSEDFTDDLVSIQIPIYIMYGSKDLGALGCDHLPIVFERAGKSNYQFSVFPGLGHNYEEIDETGASNFQQMHWQKAFDSFTAWLYKYNDN